MFSEMSDEYVDMAVLAELTAAREQHGDTFSSYDEFKEVLKDEVFESCLESVVISKLARYDGAELDIERIEAHARLGIKELAQVLAVIKKWEKGDRK